ncbi:hypothetical protein VDGD_21754 [Verticillium dahliae]|nr:hypothetical protein VDGD_21754 [Verticillium dahliae]
MVMMTPCARRTLGPARPDDAGAVTPPVLVLPLLPLLPPVVGAAEPAKGFVSSATVACVRSRPKDVSESCWLMGALRLVEEMAEPRRQAAIQFELEEPRGMEPPLHEAQLEQRTLAVMTPLLTPEPARSSS